jgi:hypothetical protein
MKMITDKVHTTRKTGNYVRYFVIILIFSMIIVACQKENTGPESILGQWSCKETSQVFEVTNYTVDISRSSTDSTKIFIENFYQLGSSYSVTAKINGLNISIPSQTVDGNQISGSGTISSGYDKINWTYNVVSGSTTDHVTAVYTK